MASRVLNVVKDRDRIIGFRIICSLKANRGIHVLSLADAVRYVKTVERFENVKYLGNNKWEGIECGLSKFPVQDKAGNFRELKEQWFVLGKMMQNGEPFGYKLMDMSGNVYYKTIPETLTIGQMDGFINAKIVSKDGSFFISAIRGTIPEYTVKPEQYNQNNMIKIKQDKIEKIDKEDKYIKFKENIEKEVKNPPIIKKDYEKEVHSAMDEKLKARRYADLSVLFAKKQKKEITDADIAKEVGAISPKEYSAKIHEYLGEPLIVSDKEILERLYKVYQTLSQSQNDTKKSPAKIERMRELIPIINKASEAYYSGKDEIMSNYEWDALYDELVRLEKETGVVLNGSPTQNVGFVVQSKLTKVKHPSKMLSLDKTKDRQELANSLGGQVGFLGLKLDGLTVVLTYENGELVSAVTRGDGNIGEDVTHNAKFFKGVPLKISYTDRLVLRGEAMIGYKDFERINAQITNVDEKYKNPRNLASGSVRQLDSKISKERHIHWVVFGIVDGFNNLDTWTGKLEEARKYGFDIVDYVMVTKDTTIKAIEMYEEKVKHLDDPTDGLVISIDNIAYCELMGTTAKYPKYSKAFKWKDEDYETTMIDIDWSVGRTGAITPVAVFKPVDIEGSTVRRASVHNVSIFKKLKLGKGDKVKVMKANLIIPQITENLTQSGTLEIPKVCPVCGQPTEIVISQQAEVLMCNNPNCLARHINSLSHFVCRDGMNIEGLSDATLDTFVNEGFVRTFKDIYHLNDYEKEIIDLDGFGRGSYNKLWKAIEKSRECELPAFIYALGIAQMGKTTSKDVCRALDYDLDRLMTITEDELQTLEGVGAKIAHEVVEYFKNNSDMVKELAKEVHFKSMPKVNRNSPISGKIFCITGDVNRFANRKELQAKIESLGGKASSSVSAKTNYLINNDITSTSNKNQTAKKLGVPIISEIDFLKMIGEA